LIERPQVMNTFMNRQSKAYAIIMFIIWPFSAVFIGISCFNSKFGRNLLVAAFVFLGYSAINTGDLERYALRYYETSDNKLSFLFDLVLNFKVGHFFTDFCAILFSVFKNHHIYFAFLFGFYAYFLINSINLLRLKIIKKSNLPVMVGFIAFAFFYSVLTVFNYSFHTGALYFLYFLLQIILNENNKRFFVFIFLTPLFHIGLTPILLVPLFFLLFRNKTNLYILLLIIFTVLSQSFIIKTFQNNLGGNNTILEEKYDSYASEEGRGRMQTRYETAYQSNNSNYRLFKDIKEISNKVAIPLLLFVFYLNRKKFINDKIQLDLFNISIACMAVTNLMLNISQGERFYIISGFMVLGTYIYFIQKNRFQTLRFKFVIYLIFPFLLLNNLVSLILVKYIISSNFLISNFPLLLFGS